MHNVVYDVVQQVFNGTLDRGYNRAVAFDLFMPIEKKGPNEVDTAFGLISTRDVTDRILEGQAASDKSQKEKGMRLGYMGHLTLIAEEVCKFGNRHPPELMDPNVLDRVNRPEWEEYVKGTLAETRDKDNAVLGGVRPENAIGMRAGGAGLGGGGGGGGSFSNATSALVSAGLGSGGGGNAAQDTLAMSEGTVGQSFEINSGTMLSGFGDGGDDEDEMDVMAEERHARASLGPRTESGGSAFSDDEQVGELSFEDVDMEYR